MSPVTAAALASASLWPPMPTGAPLACTGIAGPRYRDGEKGASVVGAAVAAFGLVAAAGLPHLWNMSLRAIGLALNSQASRLVVVFF